MHTLPMPTCGHCNGAAQTVRSYTDAYMLQRRMPGRQAARRSYRAGTDVRQHMCRCTCAPNGLRPACHAQPNSECDAGRCPPVSVNRCIVVHRAQVGNGAADTSTEATLDADDGEDETEEALEAKMQEFLRQQAQQESGGCRE
jgi:hypothetical protein